MKHKILIKKTELIEFTVNANSLDEAKSYIKRNEYATEPQHCVSRKFEIIGASSENDNNPEREPTNPDDMQHTGI